VYWALYGPRFGIGFVALIFIHEMGHYIDIKRRGLPADMPVFLPGLGAYVRWQALGVPLETRAAVSLAGPLAGLLASVACLVMWRTTGAEIWAALAHTSAWLNLLNLIPISMLDGGHATFALGRLERIGVLTASVLMWGLFSEGLFLIVAAGAVYRLFTKDLPPKASPVTFAYFLFVLGALGLVLAALPKSG
jgi:Zn-dependent protease